MSVKYAGSPNLTSYWIYLADNQCFIRTAIRMHKVLFSKFSACICLKIVIMP